MKLRSIPGKTWLLQAGLVRRFLRIWIRPLFARCGHNVRFNPFDQFSYGTISIGDDVFIGAGACFFAKKSIVIGNKVMFGPNVTIRGGNHNTSVLGKYMADVHEKRSEDDQPVVIENDVWVGAGAIILKGVAVGRGSIIGAGAIVNRNVDHYSVVAGVPAKVIRYRWNVEEILEHEKKIYRIEERISEKTLRQNTLDVSHQYGVKQT